MISVLPPKLKILDMPEEFGLDDSVLERTVPFGIPTSRTDAIRIPVTWKTLLCDGRGAQRIIQNGPHKFYWTSPYSAPLRNDQHGLEELYKIKPDPFHFGKSILLNAARSGNLKAIQFLHQKGVPVICSCFGHNTSMMKLARDGGHFDLIAWLEQTYGLALGEIGSQI
jgi:hypothetical protein